MVEIIALMPDGTVFRRSYPDSFMDEAQKLSMAGRSGREVVEALIDHQWSVPPMIVDVIKNEGQSGAVSLRLWC